MYRHYGFTPPKEQFLTKIPEPLFIEYDEEFKKKTPLHAHNFWQLEMVVCGNIVVKAGKSSIKAKNNDCVLIPTGVQHRIIYKILKQSVWSIKFKLDISEEDFKVPILLKRSNASKKIKKDIIKTMRSCTSNSVPQDVYVILQHQLASLLELEFQTRKTVNTLYSEFISDITNIILAYSGKPVTVKELAEKLNCSRNTLSGKFHKETGEQLKTFIDSQRIEIARRMLQYSNMSIKKIAERMEFNDIYSFSRFFKRHEGCYPREYRIKMTSEYLM